MKHLFALMITFCIVCNIIAQENGVTYIANHVYIKDEKTFEIVQDCGFGNQATLNFFYLQGVQYAIVTLGSKIAYTVKIVHIEEIVDKSLNIKTILMQGGVLDDNYNLIGTIRIMKDFDLSKQSNVPFRFITYVDNSNVLFEYKGIVLKK